MSDHEASSLNGIHILEGLSPDVTQALVKACMWRRYSDHEQIIDRQSESTDVFFVIDGHVRVVNYSLSSKEITLEDLGPGSHFGISPCLTDNLVQRVSWRWIAH